MNIELGNMKRLPNMVASSKRQQSKIEKEEMVMTVASSSLVLTR